MWHKAWSIGHPVKIQLNNNALLMLPVNHYTTWIALFWENYHRLYATKQSSRSWIRGAFNKFPGFFVQAFKIVVNSWKIQYVILSEEDSTLQIGSGAFPPGQCISQQLYPCHRLFDENGHQDSSSPSLYSRPCSLWLLVIPYAKRLSLWDNWGDERGCDEGHWHTHTRGLPWDLPEFVGTVQQCIATRGDYFERD